MNPTPTAAQLLVAVLDNLVVIKVAGRANFTLSIDFKRLFNELRARGHDRFALELSQCLMMDSTFLGVLAGMGMRLEQEVKNCAHPIALIAPNARILDMLENLGVKHLFRVLDNSAPAPEAFQPVAAANGNTPKVEVSRTCLEAHELLMAINPSNVAKFKDVAAFLAEDVKRFEGERK